MKNISIFVFAISTGLALCGCENEKIEEQNTDFRAFIEDKAEVQEVSEGQELVEMSELPEAYSSILDNVLNLIQNSDSNYVCNDGEVGIAEATAGRSISDSLSNIGYSCVDIDGNGVDELIITDTSEEFGERILAAYTLENEEPILLMEGYIRSRYYYLGDNLFYFEGSGGAAYSIFGLYKISKDGVSLQTIDYYFSEFKDITDVDSIGWFHNTTGEYSIDASEEVFFETDEEPYEIMAEYLSKVQPLEIISFSEYDL